MLHRLDLQDLRHGLPIPKQPELVFLAQPALVDSDSRCQSHLFLADGDFEDFGDGCGAFVFLGGGAAFTFVYDGLSDVLEKGVEEFVLVDAQVELFHGFEGAGFGGGCEAEDLGLEGVGVADVRLVHLADLGA
jgi:hypothetical protein